MEKYVAEFTKDQLAKIVSMCVGTEALSDGLDEEKKKEIREIAYVCLKADKSLEGEDIAEVYASFIKVANLFNSFVDKYRK